jgi:NADPH-dependent glutamate synthase beta subunit-like oxidoreductase
MRCAINPAVGDERFLQLKTADASRKIAIVGGGPGGMEAARIARLRGHQVTIFEKTGELGGAILYCCTVPGKHKMRWYADWLRRQMTKLDVEIRCRTSPSPEDLKNYDAVVLAGGGKVARPDIPGVDSPRVCTFEDVLRCRRKECEYWPGDKEAPVECGSKVLIWGDHFGAADAAEKLAGDGKEVRIVTENPQFAAWMEPCHRDVMMKRFAQGNGEGLKSKTFSHPVTVVANSTVTEIQDNGNVTIMDKAFRKSVCTVDTVVLANVVTSDALFKELLEAGVNVCRIGDQAAVRNLHAAVKSGANAGLTIDEDLSMNANFALIAHPPTEVERP